MLDTVNSDRGGGSQQLYAWKQGQELLPRGVSAGGSVTCGSQTYAVYTELAGCVPAVLSYRLIKTCLAHVRHIENFTEIVNLLLVCRRPIKSLPPPSPKGARILNIYNTDMRLVLAVGYGVGAVSVRRRYGVGAVSVRCRCGVGAASVRYTSSPEHTAGVFW